MLFTAMISFTVVPYLAAIIPKPSPLLTEWYLYTIMGSILIVVAGFPLTFIPDTIKESSFSSSAGFGL